MQEAKPRLFIDLDRVAENYRAVKGAFSRQIEIFYSIKANNDPRVLKMIFDMGGAFDVASWEEVSLTLGLGVPPEKIAFSNPIKKPSDIARAYGSGIRMFALDSRAEARKLAALAPGSQVYVRLTVPNNGSVWPLTGKFGVDREQAVDLLTECAQSGLEPIGATFHVGSQCLNPDNWVSALRIAADVFGSCATRGISLSMLNFGGGLPAMESRTSPPSLSVISAAIEAELDKHFGPATRLLIEPGRNIVATAGTLTATIIGEADRAGERWIYLDVGVYNGLMEIYEKFPYEVLTEHPDRPKRVYVVAGPTCDSVDVVFPQISLPEVRVGETLTFLNAGAYTTAYDRYNGFAFPAVVIEEKKRAPSVRRNPSRSIRVWRRTG
jgi:ornithine decarboxylase